MNRIRNLRDFYHQRIKKWEINEAVDYSTTASSSSKTYVRQLQDLIRSLVPAGRIIGIGAGNAFLEESLQNIGYSVLATDLFSFNEEYCKTKSIPFRQLDILQAIPLDLVGSFDALISDGVVGHFSASAKDLKDFFINSKLLLKPGGLILVGNDSPLDGSDLQRHTALEDIDFMWPSSKFLKTQLEFYEFEEVVATYIQYERVDHNTGQKVLRSRSIAYGVHGKGSTKIEDTPMVALIPDAVMERTKYKLRP